MKVKVFPTQIQSGEPFSVHKVAHSQPWCIKLHGTSFLTGEVKKKKTQYFGKRGSNLFGKVKKQAVSQFIIIVSYLQSCSPQLYFLLHDISIAVIHSFSPTRPSIIAVSLKLQFNSKSLDSTMHKKILSNKFLSLDFI